MHFRTLATDYDGTLASSGQIAAATGLAMQRWRQTGRSIVLVTGRTLRDLERACPDLTVFDRVVAEDGALLHRPQTRETVLLCEPIPIALILALRERSIVPIGLGRVVLAGSRVDAEVILEVARELGLVVQASYNKATVMVLPQGIDKASGLRMALGELDVTTTSTVSIGDAENDLSLLRCCGRGIAVANALPEICAVAHHVTRSAAGAGVAETIDEILAEDP